MYLSIEILVIDNQFIQNFKKNLTLFFKYLKNIINYKFFIITFFNNNFNYLTKKKTIQKIL